MVLTILLCVRSKPNNGEALMKTMIVWLTCLTFVTSIGCGVSADYVKDNFVAKADACTTYASVAQVQELESDVQEFAQNSVTRDGALGDTLGGLQQQVTDNQEGLQGQISGVHDRLGSIDSTLGTLQGGISDLDERLKEIDVEEVRKEAKKLRKDFNALVLRLGEFTPQNLEEELTKIRGRADALSIDLVNVRGRLDTVEEVAQAAAPKSALDELEQEVNRLSQRQSGTANSLEEARRAAARAEEQLRLEKLNRFARLHPWEGDDFYQVVDRHHNNGAKSGPVSTFLQKRDGSIVAEVPMWSSYKGKPYATGAKELRAVVCDGTQLAYDGFDAGGWPCQHRISVDLFPVLDSSLFDSPARRP